MDIQVDKRRVAVRQLPGAQDTVDRCLRTLRDVQVEAAQAFAAIDESRHYADSGCASVVEWGVQRGYSAHEVRSLTNFGKALAARPEIEAKVRRGDITLAAAACVGRVHGCPSLLQPGDQWLMWAEKEPLRVLQRRIKARFELHAQGEIGVAALVVYVPERTHDDFRRARDVASHKAREPLTDGQTFTRIVEFYLKKNDPLRAVGRKRRVGPTSQAPDRRYVPAEVVRAIRRRSGGVCEIPGCIHRLGLQLAHRKPHRDGSGREVEDLVDLCPTHHTLYDAGRIQLPSVEELDLAALARDSGKGHDPPDRVCEAFWPLRARARKSSRNRAPPSDSNARQVRVRPTGPDRTMRLWGVRRRSKMNRATSAVQERYDAIPS